MTALTTDEIRTYETPNDSNTIPVLTAKKIFLGSLVAKTDAGYGQPLTAGDIAVGFAKDNIDNTNGKSGEKTVALKAKGKVSLYISGITAADIGSKVYASDENTFTLTVTSNSYVGKLIRIEKTNYGIVAFDFFLDEIKEPDTDTDTDTNSNSSDQQGV